MDIFFGIVLVSIGIGGLVFLFFFFLHPGILPAASLPRGTITIGSRGYEIEIADTSISRMRGLSGRDALAPGSGMLFIFPLAAKYGFWMKDMKFALDFVWIRDGVVVETMERVPPPVPGSSLTSLKTYKPSQSIDMVLEIAAGEVEKAGIKAGDPVQVSR